MPFAVQYLLEGRPEPVFVYQNDPVIKAFRVMVENDFSQLPIVDREKKPKGIITYESILRTINTLKVNMKALHVEDALVRTETFHPEDDLFDLLDRLKETNAVLIIDNNEVLIGIVTSYDSNEYFRRRSEDIMMLEDVESMLRDLIRAAHSNSASGEVDEKQLSNSISAITNSVEKLRKQYQKALLKYMGLTGNPGYKIHNDYFEDSFKAFEIKEKPPEFDKLTLYEYIILFLKKWDFYKSTFDLSLDVESIGALLDEVRESRNQLAHFRGELSQEQREQIRFCADWLSRHQIIPVHGNLAAPLEELTLEATGITTLHPTFGTPELEIIPTDELSSSSESRYAHLADSLSSVPGKQDTIKLSLDQIEKIIQADLPQSAYSHRSWWANDSVGHIQSKQWLDVGWRVSYINLSDRVITFTRIVEREKAYIQFFSKLLKELAKYKKFPLKQATPDGQNWIIVATIPKGESALASFNFSFSRKHRFRVELYIDTHNKERNKAAFDILFNNREQLQQQIDEEIVWERIDDKRACRITLDHQGVISDDEAKLAELRRWAAVQMERFYQLLVKPATEALHESAKVVAS